MCVSTRNVLRLVIKWIQITLCSLSMLMLSHASDIEIYQNQEKGVVVIVMMLDTSASMDLNSQGGEEACDLPKGTKVRQFGQELKRPQNYWVNYCVDSRGRKYYDRISRLKDALYQLATSQIIPSNTKIGIGTFPYVTRSESNQRGYIRIPADYWGEVGSAQRAKVLNMIRSPQFRGQGGTPTSTAYAEAAAYMLGTRTLGSAPYSGMLLVPKEEVARVIRGRWEYQKRYISPLGDLEPSQCNGQGIYVLTDGEPQSPANANFRSVMAGALGVFEYRIEDRSGLKGGRYDSARYKSYWGAIGLFSRYLNNPNMTRRLIQLAQSQGGAGKTPSNSADQNYRVPTAVVGFGSVFDTDPHIKQQLTDPVTQKVRTYYDCNQIRTVDARNACNWGEKSKFSDGSDTIANVGGFGEGGFYSASSTDEVISSIVNFIEESKPQFEPLLMGAPSIPVDSLLPIQIQPYAYYAMFVPRPNSGLRLWQGNLNKFHIHRGEIYSADKQRRLIRRTGEIDQTAVGIWGEGGFKQRLALGMSSEQTPRSRRPVFSNRLVKADGTLDATTELQPIELSRLLSQNDNSEGADPDKNYWLNLLGFQVAANANINSLEQLPKATLRQVGAMLHSKPILLTQQGKIEIDRSIAKRSPQQKFISRDRKDYVLFGSTQGILHVLNDQGDEVFAFVPHEMMQKQKQAFLSAELSAGDGDLFYGVDATWSVHSQYQSGLDGILRVSSSSESQASLKNDASLSAHALQWVYGGLRMGGRSYYALDLSQLDPWTRHQALAPKLKFQIDPDQQRILSQSHVAGQSTAGIWSNLQALNYMGQSWSKPTLAYVNWFEGQQKVKKLVMFVGGGYDAVGGVDCDALAAMAQHNNKGYECPLYRQSNHIGAGVYMFDAHTGELLWWSSGVAASGMGAQLATQDSRLKYSVVSQINSLDRDNDGLVDAIYFGDLGGQVFRIDLNNAAAEMQSFVSHVVRLMDLNQAKGATARFYEMPSLSVHRDREGFYVAVSISSGNASSPLVEGELSAQDGIYVLYDHDIARPELNRLSAAQLYHQQSVTQLPAMNAQDGIARFSFIDGRKVYHDGWWAAYTSAGTQRSAKAGEYKGMGEVFVLDKLLYTNVYYKYGQGIGQGCGAKVHGDSYVFQYCLPTGKCEPPMLSAPADLPNRMKIGAGILGTGLAKGYLNVDGSLSVAINREESIEKCRQAQFKKLPECQLYETKTKIRTLSWDEHASKFKMAMK